MLVQQAIYTSCQTSRTNGYQLAAASGGLGDDDLRELSLWGPSHDSLWEPGPTAMSVNFHRLPSGAYCVSQTTPAGAEYSQRRGPQVYTQSLVVDAAGLAEFDNNPFALLQAAIALGHACVLEKIPKRLDPFYIHAEPQASGDETLAQLMRHPGPVWLGLLLECALNVSALGIVAGDRGASLVAALVQCLPRECRLDFSFTTGLRFSPRRPFRVICLPGNTHENQRLARHQQLTLFELKGRPPEAAALGGWASLVTAALASGNTEYLAQELAREREHLTVSGLNRLGDQLAHGLRALQSSGAKPTANKDRLPATDGPLCPVLRGAPENSGSETDLWQRADGAHRSVPLVMATQLHGADVESAPREFEGSLQIDEEPAQEIGKLCPAPSNQLQQLEDLIFEALAGKAAVLEVLTVQWAEIVAQVGPARAVAVREQYLRFAMAVWRRLNDSHEYVDPARSLQAMQVIGLLIGE